MYGSTLFHLAPCNVRLLWSDGCRPALWVDALMIRRALCEPFDKTQDKLRELARPPVTCVHLM
jgi:hypothetical protein